jgi:DNA-binding beta-propeller fold protein YncE
MKPPHRKQMTTAVKTLSVLALAAAATTPVAAQSDTTTYRVVVVSEAVDQVAELHFRGDSGWVVRTDIIGLNPVEPDGPHGVSVSPDGRHYFVTTGHGLPFGDLWKFTARGVPVSRVTLGMFPASLQVSPDGHYVYVSNFNLHGEMVPSSVSIVAADEMVELARLETCTMPHGSRFNSNGSRHYSTCMMDDLLVEIDATKFEVSRKFPLSDAAGGDHANHGSSHGAAPAAVARGGTGSQGGATSRCSPTWAAPSPPSGVGGVGPARVYVACNASNEVVEVDPESWQILRRIPAANGVYNLAVTHDGSRLVATNKKSQSISVFDLASGTELARIPTRRPVVHGVAISRDDRYAFISVEGYGSEPGTVEMIDLRTLRSVAQVDVGQMAAGIETYPAP